jgi:hypothetical protein
MLVAILFWLAFCVLVGVYASKKGRSGPGFFFLAALLSPIVGFIIALVVRPLRANIEAKELASGDLVKCPFCAELVKAEAKVCKHCGRDIPAVVADTKEATAVTPSGVEQSKLLALCGRLKEEPLNYDEYEHLAKGAGASLSMRSGMMSSQYFVTHGDTKCEFKSFSALRPWYLENIVPAIQNRA